MSQPRVDVLMTQYIALTPVEKIEFRGMLTGYDMRGQVNVTAGKKAAATKKSAASAKPITATA